MIARKNKTSPRAREVGRTIELQYFSIRPDFLLFPDQWFLDDPLTAAGETVDSRQFVSGVPYLGPVPTRGQIGQVGKEMQFSLSAFDMPIVSPAIAEMIRRFAPNPRNSPD